MTWIGNRENLYWFFWHSQLIFWESNLHTPRISQQIWVKSKNNPRPRKLDQLSIYLCNNVVWSTWLPKRGLNFFRWKVLPSLDASKLVNLHRTESTFCISPAQKYLFLYWFKNLTRGCTMEEEMSSLSSAPSCHWLELCMNIVSPLGGIEVECWWLTAGCALHFLKGSFLRMSFS